MKNAVIQQYRARRRHQLGTYGSVTRYPNGRTEYTGGGAPYGEHAVSALMAARAHLHFLKRLHEAGERSRKRSAAACRGWRTRRNNQGA